MARFDLLYNDLPCLEGPSRTLPASAHATPMGYRYDGMDYVVVAAGGWLTEGGGRGDYVVAFRLGAESPYIDQ